MKSKVTFCWAACVLLIAGCNLSGPSGTGDQAQRPDTPVVVPPSTGDIWSALATAVDRKTIGTKRELAQYVKALSDNGELSDDAVSDFNSAFRGATTSEVELTKSDSSLLRSLK